MNLKGRHFLTLKDYTEEEILYLLDLSAELKDKKKKGILVDTLKDVYKRQVLCRAMDWRFILVRDTVSLSTRARLPTPLLARASMAWLPTCLLYTSVRMKTAGLCLPAPHRVPYSAGWSQTSYMWWLQSSRERALRLPISFC